MLLEEKFKLFADEYLSERLSHSDSFKKEVKNQDKDLIDKTDMDFKDQEFQLHDQYYGAKNHNLSSAALVVRKVRLRGRKDAKNLTSNINTTYLLV